MKEAQQRIDAAEFAEWMAFDQLCPFGTDRLALILAQFSAMYFNRYKKASSSEAKPIDFMPFMFKPTPKPTLKQHKQSLELIAAAMGVKV